MIGKTIDAVPCSIFLMILRCENLSLKAARIFNEEWHSPGTCYYKRLNLAEEINNCLVAMRSIF